MVPGQYSLVPDPISFQKNDLFYVRATVIQGDEQAYVGFHATENMNKGIWELYSAASGVGFYGPITKLKDFEVATIGNPNSALGRLNDDTTGYFSLGKYKTYTLDGHLYEFKAVRPGDRLVIEPFLDFIPCYRKADGEIGFYEMVNGKFYTNNGAGTYGKGPNV